MSNQDRADTDRANLIDDLTIAIGAFDLILVRLDDPHTRALAQAAHDRLWARAKQVQATAAGGWEVGA